MSEIISGRKPIIEALKAGTKIEKIVLLAGVHGRAIDEIKSLSRQNDVPTTEVTKPEFRELAGDTMSQGAVAVIRSRPFVDVRRILQVPLQRNEKGFILILDGIEDPQNLGALIRTAECAGVHGVIIPRHHAAPISGAVVKASAGATEHMLIAQVTNIVRTLEELKKEGFWIVGLDADEEQVYTEVDYSLPIVVVVGGEGKGIRRLVKEHCDFRVRIPLFGRIGSLNASVAGALAIYEVTRQRMRR